MLTLSVVEFEVTTVTEIVVQHSRSSSRASGVESPAVATPSKDIGNGFELKTRRSSVSSSSTTMDDPCADGDATQEAQRTAQLERLSGTRTGRQVLRNLGMEPRRADEETAEGAEVPECVRRHVQVRPIPKNVNPEYNRERRAARARALIDLHARDNGAVYVDAAEYKDRRGAAAVVSAVTGETKAAASVRARAAHRAEEVAIALALADPDRAE
ncbi:hypothetical protein MTO96_016394 [Rhipicephalus appendiculatus]